MVKQIVASVCVLAGTLSIASAQSTLYWDINGATPGAGQVDGFTDGIWGTDSFWSTDPNGEVATGAWVDGSNAVFSAGEDAVDHFININGAPLANSLTVEEGIVEIASGSVDTPSVNLQDGTTLAFGSTARFVRNEGTFLLQGGQLSQKNPGNAGSFLWPEKTIEIDGTGVLSYDDGDEVNNYVSIYSGTILGTGGTTSNGGAGTLIKRGPDRIGLSGANQANYTFAKLIIEEGYLQARHTDGTIFETVYGAVPLTVTPDAVTIDGGQFGANAGFETHENRGFLIGPNGAEWRGDGFGTITINGPLSGSGTLRLFGGGGGIRLANAGNVSTFSGNVVVDDTLLTLLESLNTPNFSGAADGVVSVAEGKSFTFGSDNANATFAGNLVGEGDAVKIGTGTQTLSGEEAASSANMVVEAGTLSLTAPILTDTADVSLLTGTTLNLDFSATNIIQSFFIDNVAQALGTWGAVGSGAANESALITGSGLLEVTDAGVEVLIGDYNQDGTVNIADYTVWRNNLGADGSVLLNRDPANTGAVDASDYDSWKSNFGQSAAAATLATVSVPEPTTCFLAAVGLLGLIMCRKR